MGDDYLSNSLICFVEKEMLDNITNEVIVKRFHVKSRRGMKRKEVMFSSLFYLFISIYILSIFKDVSFSCSLKLRNLGRMNKKERHIDFSSFCALSG